MAPHEPSTLNSPRPRVGAMLEYVASEDMNAPPRLPAVRSRHRVLIADDHPIVRQGLRRLIEQEEDLCVCGEAESVREAKAAIRELHPDVVIVDISLRQGDGIELVKDTRAHHPAMPLLVLSMHDEAIYAERMLSAGANGYIMKQAAGDQFLLALRRVLEGGIYVSEAVGNSISRSLLPAAPISPPTPSTG
jgi:DNA-binding NarL/FixJ family response regulator